jgi:hypothetical protein
MTGAWNAKRLRPAASAAGFSNNFVLKGRNMLFADAGQGFAVFLIVMGLMGIGIKKLWRTFDGEGHVNGAAKGAAIRFFENLFTKK